MEVLEDIQVTKIVEPKLLGVHQEKNVYLYTGKFGEYLKHDGYNYSIPKWGKKILEQEENSKEMFGLYHAINIIDWKVKQKIDKVSEERKAKFSNAKNYKQAFLEDNE